jgi:hypothetical protein
MSSASGVKVSPEVTEAWVKACSPSETNVRALVLQIEQGTFQFEASICVVVTEYHRFLSLIDAFVLKNTIAPSGSFEEDVASLPKDAKTCATYVYRTDEKKGNNGWHWVLITFVPDHAGVSTAIKVRFLDDTPCSEQALICRSGRRCFMRRAKGAFSKLSEKVASSRTCSLLPQSVLTLSGLALVDRR